MAEERSIDRDKDKKYKIRINEDGEEELYIDETEDEEEEQGMEFEVPDLDEDDEEAAILTPEQLAELEEKRAREALERAERISVLFKEGDERYASGDMSGAIDKYSAILELDDKNGLAYVCLLKAFTYGFTNFEEVEAIEELTDGVATYATPEERERLLPFEELVKNEVNSRKRFMEECSVINEEGRESRRSVFAKAKKKASIAFIATITPFVIALAMTILFSTMMFADKDGLYLVLTGVFGGVSIVLFFVTVFTARAFVSASRRVRLNKKDTSTKAGRAYLAAKQAYELLEAIEELF